MISQFRTRTATSQFDEYAQNTNSTDAAVDLSGWQLYDCFQSGSAQKVGTDSDPLQKGTMLPAGASFVFGKDDGDYTGVADATYGFQVTETGGFQLRDATGAVQGGVGAPDTACAEGPGLTLPTTGSDFTFTRKTVGGTLQDTDDNQADFVSPSGQADGTPCGAPCQAPPVPTGIDAIQGDGASSPLVGDNVQITGVVIGVDNQQDVSNFVDLQPESAGILCRDADDRPGQQPRHVGGIFVGDLPAADRTADHIGQTVTVSGQVDEQFGLTTLDAADVDRLRALRRANEIRAARAELKQRLAAQELSASPVILNPTSESSGWSIGKLLMSQRGWGEAKCRRLLSRAQRDPARPLGDLTERQRNLLVSELNQALRGQPTTDPC